MMGVFCWISLRYLAKIYEKMGAYNLNFHLG